MKFELRTLPAGRFLGITIYRDRSRQKWLIARWQSHRVENHSVAPTHNPGFLYSKPRKRKGQRRQHRQPQSSNPNEIPGLSTAAAPDNDLIELSPEEEPEPLLPPNFVGHAGIREHIQKKYGTIINGGRGQKIHPWNLPHLDPTPNIPPDTRYKFHPKSMLDNQKCGLTLVIKRITIKEKEEKREEKEKEEEEKEEKKKEGEEMTIEEEDIVIIDVDPDDLIGLYHVFKTMAETDLASRAKRPVSRSQTKYWIVGVSLEKFGGGKLPFNRIMLRRYLFERELDARAEIRAIASRLVQEILDRFWYPSRIPTKDVKDCIDQFVDLIFEYVNIKKIPIQRRSNTSVLEKEQRFSSKLGSLLDISHKNKYNLLKQSGCRYWMVDWEFLLGQRKFPQFGTMDRIDQCLAQQEKRRNQLEQNVERIKQAELAPTCVEMKKMIIKMRNFVMEKNRKRRRSDQVTIEIPTRGLIQASSVVSDGMRVSQRQQLLVLGSAVTSGGGSLGDITLSKTSIERLRTARRMREAKSIMENWIRPPLATLHWDSKLFKLITGKKEDRLAVYASQPPKLLGIPSIESSTGRNQMEAVVSLVENGEWNGAAILIEKRLNRTVLRCECRHHVAELHIKHTFKVVFGENKAPTIKLFQRLKEDFDNVDKDEEQLKLWHWPENQDDFLFKQALEVKIWVTKCIEKNTFPREDYRELCELILFYLAGSIPRGFFIRRPGADHHARFMSKAIYILKIYLLSGSFEMTPTELKQVERMAVYIGLFYGNYFLQSALTAAAAANDLHFFYLMKQFSVIDPEAAKETIKPISRHLSYLTEELVVFSLFGDSLNYAEKTMIGKRLYDTNIPINIPPNKPKLPDIVWRDDKKPLLSSFVGSKSWLLFNLLKLEGKQEWLNILSEHWHNFKDFKKAKHFAVSFLCVNDSAERGIKLITDYKDSCFGIEEREYLAQIVIKHRKKSR
ncbi:Cc8K15.2-like protein [Daphnia magna]|uniref:Cc8K15.2-like protein n=1 Tax=Daphnia magna TaxID=35525 RepID=A0A164TKT7_9CRUS|nr:Cc8K15.2-like protein [Daphnia magna]